MNQDTAAAKPHVLSALRKANNVIGIADVHGWPRPQAYTDAHHMLNEARAASLAIPTVSPHPVKPKDVQKWIDATVEVRHQEATRRDVVDELVLHWERETATAGLAATNDINARLITAFDELVTTFDEHADAPRQLTGHETSDEVNAHTAALRLAGELSNALMMRVTIGDAAQEAEYVGHDIIWLALQPHAATTRDQVNDALHTFQQRIPQTLAEWDALRPLGLRLARIGEVEARRQRHSDLMWEIGMSTPGRGMHDHSYGEIEGMTNPAPHGPILQAESNAIFDQQQSFSM